MNRILRNIGWLLGGRGVNALFSIVYLALATRSLGLEDFGRFSLIIVLAQAITGIASFQTWQAVVRWGAVPGEAGKAAGFALALDLASVLGGGLVAALVCLTAHLWLPLPPELRMIAFLQCLAALLAIRSTPTGLLRLHDRYDLASVAEAVQPATRAAGAVLAALLFPHIGGFVAAWAAAELTCAAAYWYFARKLERLHLADVRLRQLPSRHEGVWRFVWATNFSRSLAVSAKQVLLLFVGALGGAALAGGYRVASQLGMALVQLGETLSRAIYPEFVRAVDTAHGLARRMVSIALCTGTVAVLGSVIMGKWALTLIAGPAFGFAHGAMILLSLAGAIELLGASWDALLVARGKAEIAFIARAAPLVLAMATTPMAIALGGLEGVAACTAGASLLTVAGLAQAARRDRLRGTEAVSRRVPRDSGS